MSPATIPLPPTPPESPHRGRRAVVPAIVLLLVMVAGTAVLVDAVLRARTQAAVAQQVVDQQQGVELALGQQGDTLFGGFGRGWSRTLAQDMPLIR